jgi:hypothetical protein
MIVHEADPELTTTTTKILWTDEATFKTNGRVNRHNCVYWSDTNPHQVIQEELNVPGVTAKAGIWVQGVVGPLFIESTVTANLYLELLQTTVVPELGHHYDLGSVIWQQDEAPPHFRCNVHTFLDEKFPMWIGRCGKVEWPPRSPDLMPCDFAMWGVIKHNRVYSKKPANVLQMKHHIHEELNNLDKDKILCTAICEAVVRRCQMCNEHAGQQSAQFLYLFFITLYCTVLYC